MKIICANFKMNLLKEDILNYLEIIDNKIPKDRVIFFPNELYINYFKNQNYLVGSQNISYLENGSLTGDTSILSLKEVGINYTLIGHSERREFYNDSKYVNKKIALAIKNNVIPILCVGETKLEHEEKKTIDVIKKELDEALKEQTNLTNDNLIIAYEPIWSIGTSITPSNNSIDTTLLEIKTYIKKQYNLNPKVLYGGSVSLKNIDTLEALKNHDGYLIGTASLDANNFLSLINKVK